LLINASLLGAELVGGIAFGSLALLADATHLVSDVLALAGALMAVLLAARPVSPAHSFGLARAEVLAVQASAVIMVATAGWILLEATARLRAPAPVNGAGLTLVAGVGLLANLASAGLVHRARGDSLNMRASFLHLAVDAAGSLAALLAGVAILVWGQVRADAVASMVTAGLVLCAGWGLLREATHILMEGVPRGLDPDQVAAAVRAVDGVVDLHHLHLWNIASDVPALSAHVVVTGQPSLSQAQRTADRIRAVLSDRFALTNVTLELECGDSPGAPAATQPLSRPATVKPRHRNSRGVADRGARKALGTWRRGYQSCSDGTPGSGLSNRPVDGRSAHG
jgi:cobalt-zinc-cadmium efflux system protein